MKELFVSYELALMAKEKGFNDPCLKLYTEEYKELITAPHNATNTSVKDSLNTKPFTAPLYQQLVDWFRDKHKIFIQIDQKLLEMNYSPSEINYSFEIRDNQDKILYPKSTIQDALTDYRVGTKYYHSDYYFQVNKALEESFKLI